MQPLALPDNFDDLHEATYLIRTDFSDDDAWHSISEAIRAPWELPGEDPMEQDYILIDDPEYAGLSSVEQIQALLPEDYDSAVVVLVDAEAVRDPDSGVLVFDIVNLDEVGFEEDFDEDDEDEYEGDEDYQCQFARIVPSEVTSAVVNLNVGNVSIDELHGYP